MFETISRGQEIIIQGLHDDALAELEAAFVANWTGSGSTPFLADIHLSEGQRETAMRAIRQQRLWRLFSKCPTVAVWAVLSPLAAQYGADTKDVYSHISRFVGEDFSDASSRDDLKMRYRRAARAIGLPVLGNQPTDLFFAPLGPALSQHSDLARAFIGAALHLGPPATEDTPSARHWQRRAVRDRCPTLTRLQATITFDTSAWCARRFEAWRQGQAPCGTGELHLFEAYERAARSHGRKREDIVGPPRVFWFGDGLGLEAEPTRQLQKIHVGLFPKQIQGRERLRLPPPWSTTIDWSAGPIRQAVPFAPDPGEILLFDADSGTLVGRAKPRDARSEVAAARLVALSPHPFGADTFGDSIPAADPAFQVAWINAGETLRFEDRPDLALGAPEAGALWIDGVSIARDGPRALYACDGSLVLKINPDIGGSARIVRARSGDDTRFVSVEIPSSGQFSLSFSRLGLDAPGDPHPVTFEVVAPGAAGDMDARAELSTTCWIWPGVAAPKGDLADVLEPSNHVAARSAGLRVDAGRISVDPRSDVEAPILGLLKGDRVHEFQVTARGEKLWHCRIAAGDRVFVPRGATLTLGHDNRHDTLTLRSPDRDATLMVLGHEKRCPFLQRQIIEIGAGELETAKGGDDRIALRRTDGRVDVLARLHRVEDPARIVLRETDDSTFIGITPQARYDALRVRLETVDGEPREGDYVFGRRPSPLRPLSGVTATSDLETGRLDIRLDRRALLGPARLLFWTRSDSDGHFQPLRDADSAWIAVALRGEIAAPDIRKVVRLATFLADPEPDVLGGQLSATLYPCYSAAFERAATARMVGAIKPLLNVGRQDGQPPRHDLVGLAPWIFEAAPHAYAGLSEDSGLSPLERMREIAAPDPLPTIAGDTPLEDWLSRVGSDMSLPGGLDTEALQHAFRTLRYRLADTDLCIFRRDSPAASTAQLLCSTHVEGLDALRSFDQGGGGDTQPARIAALIERFARGCAEHRAEAFVTDLMFRTGFARREVGTILTLLLRAGIEFFVYFRTLWTYAVQNETPKA